MQQSLDYNFKHSNWSTTTSEGAYASFGPFNAGVNFSQTYDITNSQWNTGWGVSAGIGIGNDKGGIGLSVGYGSGGWTYGLSGHHYTSYERAYMRAEQRNRNNIEAVFASYEQATFDQLWDNYPSSSIVHRGASGGDIFSDHCAINMSEALMGSGIYLNGGVRCWGSCPSGGGHFIRAQELANSLNGRYNVTTLTGSNFYGQIRGKQGIVFFQDYWHRSTDPIGVRTGDHIDLWNGSYLKSNGWTLTRMRLNFPNMMENFGSSNLYKSRAVWFWQF